MDSARKRHGAQGTLSKWLYRGSVARLKRSEVLRLRRTSLRSWAHLFDDRNGCSLRRPVVQEGRHVHRQVDAAVAHRGAEVAVPVGAVQRVAEVVEVHDVGHVLDPVMLAADRAFHRLRVVFDEDRPVADQRYGLRYLAGAGADETGDHEIAVL